MNYAEEELRLHNELTRQRINKFRLMDHASLVELTNIDQKIKYLEREKEGLLRLREQHPERFDGKDEFLYEFF